MSCETAQLLTKEAAIAAWNRRAMPPVSEAMVEAVAGAISAHMNTHGPYSTQSLARAAIEAYQRGMA